MGILSSQGGVGRWLGMIFDRSVWKLRGVREMSYVQLHRKHGVMDGGSRDTYRYGSNEPANGCGQFLLLTYDSMIVTCKLR